MLRIVFLCSGGGGNLRFIVEAIRLRWLKDAVLCGVITDRECAASVFARQENIPVVECDFSEANQLGFMSTLIALDPGIIVTNVHKILSPAVVERFRGKLLNLHYSLLPAFGGVIGAKPISLALQYGVQLVGASAHLVDESVDGGTPVVQGAIPVVRGDDVPVLMDVVFRVGCICLWRGIQLIRQDRQITFEKVLSVIEVSGRSVLINPPVASIPEFLDESFWGRLR
jgi:phosphoribosylglycinamide formyltransferase 1